MNMVHVLCTLQLWECVNVVFAMHWIFSAPTIYAIKGI